MDGQQSVGIAKFIAPAFENNCSGEVSTGETTESIHPDLQPLNSGRFRMDGFMPNGVIPFRNS